MNGPSVEELMARPWLFVGGSVRSGTTLCQHLLSLHPRCEILCETSFGLNVLHAVHPQIAGREGYYRVTFAGRWTNEHRMVEWGLTRLRYCTDDLHDVARRMAAGIRSMYPDTTVFGDKSADYGPSWRGLRKTFPGCKIIVMERDLEATINSILDQGHWWDPRPPDADAEPANYRAWRQRLRPAAKKWALSTLDPLRDCPNTHWVKLEEMEAEPKKIIRGMLQYVGLDPGEYPWAKALKRFEPGSKVN